MDYILKAAANNSTITHEETLVLSRQVRRMLELLPSGKEPIGVKVKATLDVLNDSQHFDVGNNAADDMDVILWMQEIKQEIQLGLKAREKMILANQRLVINIAKRYKGLTLDERIQHGMLGLAAAVERFNPDLGYKFSTYAVWRIKQSITGAIQQQARCIRLPGHVGLRLYKIEKALGAMSELGESITPRNIAARTGIEPERVSFLLNLREQTTPLCNRDKAVEQQEDGIPENVWTALGNLEKDELEAIALKYGLADGRQWIVAEIAAALEKPEKEVRVLLKGGMDKIRQQVAA